MLSFRVGSKFPVCQRSSPLNSIVVSVTVSESAIVVFAARTIEFADMVMMPPRRSIDAGPMLRAPLFHVSTLVPLFEDRTTLAREERMVEFVADGAFPDPMTSEVPTIEAILAAAWVRTKAEEEMIGTDVVIEFVITTSAAVTVLTDALPMNAACHGIVELPREVADPAGIRLV